MKRLGQEGRIEQFRQVKELNSLYESRGKDVSIKDVCGGDKTLEGLLSKYRTLLNHYPKDAPIWKTLETGETSISNVQRHYLHSFEKARLPRSLEEMPDLKITSSLIKDQRYTTVRKLLIRLNQAIKEIDIDDRIDIPVYQAIEQNCNYTDFLLKELRGKMNHVQPKRLVR